MFSGTNDESSSDSSDRSTLTQSLLHVATNKLALQMSPPESSVVEASCLGKFSETHCENFVNLLSPLFSRKFREINAFQC